MTEAELHAFLDGELEAGRAQIVAGLIEADPILRQRVAAYRSDHERLRTIYQPLIEEPLPARLVRAVTAEPAARRPIGVWAAGATLAAAAAIALVLWSGALDRPQDGLLAEALAVRNGSVTAEQQLADVPAADGDALVAKTLSPSVKIPDLGQEGYKLAGLAVYPDHAHGKAVQLSYSNAQGKRLTVYLHRPTGTDRYEILPEKQGHRVCIWENQELSAVMVGDGMSEQEMLRTAQRAYHPLNF